MTLVNYTFFINHLKINIAKKRYFFDVLTNAKILNLINVLYRINVVRRFVRLRGNKYRIYLTWFDKHSNPFTLKTVNRSHNFVRIKARSLKILANHTLTSHLILSTSKGLITHQEALKHKVGGFLICTIH